jgi:hypothetical protein
MNDNFIPVLAITVVFGSLCWVAWLIFSTLRRYKTAKLQSDVQHRLLEKFGSSQDLLSYVQTDAGKQFLDSLATEQPAPYARILGAVQAGIIMTFFGTALLALRGKVADSEMGFLVFGTLILTLGIAFIVSAAVSYVLSKSFGLLSGAAAQK